MLIGFAPIFALQIATASIVRANGAAFTLDRGVATPRMEKDVGGRRR